MLPATVDKRVSNLIVFAGPATTLAISPWFNFDPINLIKVLILTCISFAAFGLVLPYLPYVISKVGKKNSLLLLLFFAAFISPFFLVEPIKHNSSGVFSAEIQEYFPTLHFWQYYL